MRFLTAGLGLLSAIALAPAASANPVAADAVTMQAWVSTTRSGLDDSETACRDSFHTYPTDSLENLPVPRLPDGYEQGS